MDEGNNKCLQLSYGRDFQFSSQLGKNCRNASIFSLHVAHNTGNQHLFSNAKSFALRNI